MPRAPQRPCATPGCSQLIPTGTPLGRCDTCRTAHEAARGTREDRGYGREHKRLRALLAPKVASGCVLCWRCGKPIPAGAVWHLGHKPDRSYGGPEHEACNLGAAGAMSKGRQA